MFTLLGEGTKRDANAGDDGDNGGGKFALVLLKHLDSEVILGGKAAVIVWIFHLWRMNWPLTGDTLISRDSVFVFPSGCFSSASGCYRWLACRLFVFRLIVHLFHLDILTRITASYYGGSHLWTNTLERLTRTQIAHACTHKQASPKLPYLFSSFLIQSRK